LREKEDERMWRITPVEQEGSRLASSGVTVHLALVGSHQTIE
jgi:hypothetical protein